MPSLPVLFRCERTLRRVTRLFQLEGGFVVATTQGRCVLFTVDANFLVGECEASGRNFDYI